MQPLIMTEWGYHAACVKSICCAYMYLQPLITSEWGYHTARVNSVAWSPDSRHVASGALDTNAIVWTAGSKTNYTVVKGICHATNDA